MSDLFLYLNSLNATVASVANQLTGFYMRATPAFNGLSK